MWLLELILSINPGILLGIGGAVVVTTSIFLIRFSYRRWYRRQMRQINRHGTVTTLPSGRVQYSVIGGGERIALIFGGPGFGFDAIYLHRYLLPQGIGLLCPSPPGYLRTSLDPAATLDTQIEMCIELLDALGMKNPIALIGIAHGAPSAIQFALRHPERTSCLVLQHPVCKKLTGSMSTHASLLGNQFLSPYRSDKINWLYYLAEHYFRHATLATLIRLHSTHSRGESKKLAQNLLANENERRRLRQFLDALSPASMRRRGVLRHLELATQLPDFALHKIKCPTLVVAGTDDSVVPADQARYAAATIPGAQLKEVSGYGAMYWFGETGRATEQYIYDFLSQNFVGPNQFIPGKSLPPATLHGSGARA